MSKINDALILGVDISDEDHSALVVGKVINGKTYVLNTILGERAIDIYKELMGLAEMPINPDETLN